MNSSMRTSILLISFIISLDLNTVYSVCPFLTVGTPPTSNASIPSSSEYETALSSLDIASVFRDIYDLLHKSDECWPSDTFNGISNYGPLFIRLTWHCSGSFRATDNKGGCAGGRIRFWPEASWDDNTNLDKARALLVPIKEKYGIGLSWGDLFVFSGTAAIMNMSGPATEICAGRIDSSDGTDSLPLGPSDEAPPCTEQGNCEKPLGADTIGLIYVNPEGVLGNPDPSETAIRIREVFSRMDMNDTETVALIGGGHAFGKAHGACPDGAGPPPHEQPENPWPGLCSNGVFTSGFEGQWTTTPFTWDNQFFEELIDDNYTLITGDGGKNQWENNNNGFLMLTSDLALINDDKYYDISLSFAEDQEKLDDAFSKAWEKLTTSGGSWADNKRCISAADLIVEINDVDVDGDGANQYQYIYISCILLLILQFIYFN